MSKHRWDIGIAVAGVVVGALTTFFSYESNSIGAYFQILFGVGGAMLTWIIGFSLRTLEKIEELRDSVTVTIREERELAMQVRLMDKRLVQVLAEAVNHNALQGLGSSHSIVHDTIVQTLHAQLMSMQPHGHGFKVEAKNWAIYANAIFWNLLRANVKPQIPPGPNDEAELNPLSHCYALHWSNPTLWRGPVAAESLRAQGEYIKAGGKIERILISDYTWEQITQGIKASIKSGRTLESIMEHPNQDNCAVEPLEQYGDTIRLMMHFDISVYYARDTQQMSHDFVVTPSGVGKFLQVEWQYTRALEECRFSETELHDAMTTWKEKRFLAHLIEPSQFGL